MSSARRFAVFAATVWATLSSALVYAVGVGNITLHSALNQPLNADIQLLGVQSDELESLSVALAPPGLYEKMGLDVSPNLKKLLFKVDRGRDGYVIQVRSKEPIREPFLSFLLEVNWSSGRVLREFTVLLDPPVLLDEKAAPVEAPETGPPGALNRPVAPASEPAPTPSAAASDSTFTASRGELVYGPTQRGDVLWRIAEQMRPEGVSIEQMMLTLLKDNRQAFYGDNVSMLKAGQVLRVKDPSSLNAYTATEAYAEIERQNVEWQSYRDRRESGPAVAADRGAGRAAGAKGGLTPAVANGETNRLRLVTPVADQNNADIAGSGSGAAMRAELDQVRNELALATEAAEAARKENEELRQRLSALEKQVGAMQRLIQLKDQELRMLQGRNEQAAADTKDAAVELALPAADQTAAGAAEPAALPAPAEPHPTNLWTQPATIAGAVAGISLLALGGLVLQRRRRSKADAQAAELESEGFIIDSPADDGEDVADALERGPSLSIGGGIPHESGLRTELGDIDPVSEADVYIAYGRYEKAKNLVKSAIKHDPERHELKLKLLEILFLEKDTEAFVGQAEELYAALGGAEDPLWNEAVAMGHELCPENSLFSLESVSTYPIFGRDVPDSVIDGVAGEAPSVFADSVAGAEEKQWQADRVTEFAPAIDEEMALEADNRLEADSEHDVHASKVAWEESGLGVDQAAPREPVAEEDSEWQWLDDMELGAGVGQEPPAGKDSVPAQEPDSEEVRWLAQVEEEALADLPDVMLGSDTAEMECDDAAELESVGAQSEQAVAPEEESLSDFSAFMEETPIEDNLEEDRVMEEAVDSEMELAVLDEPRDNDTESETEEVSGQAGDQPETDDFSEYEPEYDQIDQVIEEPAKIDDSSFFLFTDEVGTKLDLARAYIEMGDREGAREILAEVIDEGNEQQKQEAQELLDLAS